MSNLKIVDFIKSNEDWEKLLSEKPFCIKTSRAKVFHSGKNLQPVCEDLIMFKYSQIDSDFYNEIVRECRGLILNEKTLEPVCIPFFKFGNYGEGYVPEIDWKSAKVTEKIDGSLIKITKRENSILISTNGMINAFDAEIQSQIGCEAKSYGDLVLMAIDRKMKFLDFSNLIQDGMTYMFELTSPFNRVVVQWKEIELHFLGARDNHTLQEIFFDDERFKVITSVFTPPKVFSLGTIDECVNAANHLGPNEEGYVVIDSSFNRVKVKSPTYVSLHHMRDNGNMSFERGLEIVRKNEIEEVTTYFPEFKEHLYRIKNDYDLLIDSLIESYKRFSELKFESRKESAFFIQKNFRVPSVGFLLLDRKISSVKEWAESIPSEKMCQILGYK